MGYNAVGEGDLDRVFITNAELVDQFIGEKLYSWGYGSAYALGTGNNSNYSSPVSVAGGGANWKQISSVNNRHAAGIKTDGTLWTWGDGYYNNTGGGGSSSPLTIAGGGTNWNYTSVGQNVGAGIKTDGTLWTWGANVSGQLGDGTTSSRNSPVSVVGGINSWKTVSVGGQGTNVGAIAAIKADGSMWTWGANSLLADYTTSTDRSSPNTIFGPPSFKETSSYTKNVIMQNITSPLFVGGVTRSDSTAIYFNGATNLRIPNSEQTTPYAGTWTIEGWFNTTVDAGTLYCNGLDPALGGIRILCSTTYGITAYIGSSSFNGPTSQFISGGWNHFAVVSNNGQIITFVNGILGTSATYVGTPLIYVENKFSFIGSTEFNTSYFSGYIDQLRVLKGVAKYSANFTVPLYPFYDSYSTDPYYNNVSLLLKSDGINGSNNNIFLNSSNNISVITRNGNVSQGTFSPYSLPEGVWSNSFDGSGDYLSVPDNDAFEFGTGDFTIECWVNFNSTSSVQTLVGHYLNSTTGWSLQWRSDNGKWSFGNGDTQLITYTNTPTIGRWYHYCICRSGTTLRMFLDGTQVSSATNSTNIAGSTNTLTIGALNGTGIGLGILQYTNGYLSNVRIVKGTALYISNFTPSTTPLTAIANTSLLTCQSNRFVDNSINNFTLTPSGDVKPSTSSPFSQITDILSTRFNGANYLSLNGPTSLAFGTNPFTIEFWLYINGTNTSVIYDSRPTSTNGNYACIYLQSNQIRYYVASADRIAGATLSSGVWYHIALCRNSGSTRLFVNGVQSGSTYTDTTNYLNPTGRPFIGNAGHSASYFNGQIYNLRVLNGTGLYTGTFAVPQLPLKSIANTALLTCQSSLNDNGPNALVITNNSNVNLVSVPPILNEQVKSLNFPGGGAYRSYATNAAFNFGTSDFTIECYCYWIPGGSDGPQLMGRTSLTSTGLNGGAGAWVITFANTTNPSAVFNFVYQSSVGSGSASIGSVFQRTWHHIAIVRTSGVIKTYNNGVLVSTDNSAAAAGNFDCTLLMNIGLADSVPWHAFIGNLCSIRIVNGTAVYTSNFTPPKTLPSAIPGTSLLLAQSTTGNDQSINAFTPSSTSGTITPTSLLPYPMTEFYTGSSMYFDGTGDYLDAGSNAAYNFDTGNFTVECWFYRLSVTGRSDFMGSYASPTSGWGISTSLTNSGDVAFYYGNTVIAISSGSVWTANSWNHVAVARNGTSLDIYINGVSVATATDSTNISSGSSLKIGAAGNATQLVTGYISNARVVKGSAVYTANFTPPTAPLTAISGTSLLLNCTNAGIIDNAGKNDIETVGNAQVSTSVKKYGTGSMYFDGSGDRLLMGAEATQLSGNFTIEFWAYRLSGGAGWRVCVANYLTWTSGSFFFGGDTGGSGINFGSNNTGDHLITIGSPFPQNTWTHLAAVRSGSTITIYSNGISVGSFTDSTNYSLSQGTIVGGIPGAFPNEFNGYIDDLRITKGIARYTSNFVPPIRSLPDRYSPIDTSYNNVTLQINTVDLTSNTDYSSGWSSVSVGGNHAMAIKQDGSLWAWGSNNRGQLGDPTATANIPSLNVYGGNYKQVSCSGTHSAMIKTDGTLWTCGYNNVGQLGDGTTTSRSSPVSVFGGGTNWKQVSATGNYLTSGATVAVKTDGTLWAWGYNGYGGLGQNNITNYSSPVQLTITNVNNWKSVTGGISVLAIGQD